MLQNKLNFVIDNDHVQIIDGDDSRFAKVMIDVCSTEPNSHGVIFTSNVLEAAVPTLPNMPILAKFNPKTNDVQGHEEDEVSLGAFFNSKEIFVEKKGEHSYVRAVGYLWRKYKYVNDVLDCLKERNGKASVSMEIEAKMDDNKEVKSFVFQGVTILGAAYRPSIPNAQLEVISFSEMKKEYEEHEKEVFVAVAEKRYAKIDFTIPDAVIANATGAMSKLSGASFSLSTGAVGMARYLSSEKKAQPIKVVKMNKYLKKHSQDTFVTEEPYNTAYISWLCYGGKEGMEWTERVMKEMSDADKKVLEVFTNDVNPQQPQPSAPNQENGVQNDPVQATAPENQSQNQEQQDAQVQAQTQVPNQENVSEPKQEEDKNNQGEVDKDNDEDEDEDDEEEQDSFKDHTKMDNKEFNEYNIKCVEDLKGLFNIADGKKITNKKFNQMKIRIEKHASHLIELQKFEIAKKQELIDFKQDVLEKMKLSRVAILLDEVGEDLKEQERDDFKVMAQAYSLDTISSWENIVKAKAYQNAKENPHTGKNNKKNITIYAAPDSQNNTAQLSVWEMARIKTKN